ncbi:MAG: hypothetical protein ACJ79H_06850, partial [Myxococcales bacterium]
MAVVAVELTGQGGGHVRSPDKSIDCPGTCGMTATIGATIALAQEAEPGSIFVGWGGGCSGPGACSLTVKSGVTVWAHFEKSAPLPPAAQCAGVVGTAPPPVSHGIPMAGNFTCLPGLGDSAGTLGLLTQGSRPGDGTCMSCTRQRNFSFVDETSGQEKNFAGFLGSSGTHEAILPQPEGFVIVTFVPSGPAFLSATHYDRSGRAVSRSNPMLGAPVVKEAAPGGVLYAGDFNAQDQDLRKAPRHQACFLNQDLSIRWCKDLASKGPV